MDLIVQPQATDAVIQLSLLDLPPQPSPLPVPIEQVFPNSFELREYQTQVIKDLYQLFKQGKKRPFIYAPTGSGKTVIACKILSDAVSRERWCLFLVHREPLGGQTQKALAVHGIEAGIIKAKYKEDWTLSVQIASIQSLAQRQFPSVPLLVAAPLHMSTIFENYIFTFHSNYLLHSLLPLQEQVLDIAYPLLPRRTRQGTLCNHRQTAKVFCTSPSGFTREGIDSP